MTKQPSTAPRRMGATPQSYLVRFFVYDDRVSGEYWETTEHDFSLHAMRFEWSVAYQRFTNDDDEVVLYLKAYPNALPEAAQ